MIADGTSKHERCDRANQLIRRISELGHRTFHYQGVTARLEVDSRGRVWFHDEYSKKRIYTAYRYRWRGFNHGGTMRALIDALCDYIKTGRPICGHLGPWSDWLYGGDLWGYGIENMENIRAYATELGIYQE